MDRLSSRPTDRAPSSRAPSPPEEGSASPMRYSRDRDQSRDSRYARDDWRDRDRPRDWRGERDRGRDTYHPPPTRDWERREERYRDRGSERPRGRYDDPRERETIRERLPRGWERNDERKRWERESPPRYDRPPRRDEDREAWRRDSVSVGYRDAPPHRDSYRGPPDRRDTYERRHYERHSRSPSPPRRRIERSPIRDRWDDRPSRPPPRDRSTGSRRGDDFRSTGGRSPPKRVRSPSAHHETRDRSYRRRRTASPSPAPSVQRSRRSPSPRGKDRARVESLPIAKEARNSVPPPSLPSPHPATTLERVKEPAQIKVTPPQNATTPVSRLAPSPIPSQAMKISETADAPQKGSPIEPPAAVSTRRLREPAAAAARTIETLLRPGRPQNKPNGDPADYPYISTNDNYAREREYAQFEGRLKGYRSVFGREKQRFKKHMELGHKTVQDYGRFAELELAETEFRGIAQRVKLAEGARIDIQYAPPGLSFSIA